MNRENSKVIALIGAMLLGIGVFLPVVRVPKMGTLNLIHGGRGDGMIILLLVAIIVALALLNRTRHVIWPGIASLLMLGFTFSNVQSGLSRARRDMAAKMDDNPFAAVADAATASIQLEWGWAVLVLGAIMVIAAGITAWRGRAGPPPQS